MGWRGTGRDRVGWIHNCQYDAVDNGRNVVAHVQVGQRTALRKGERRERAIEKEGGNREREREKRGARERNEGERGVKQRVRAIEGTRREAEKPNDR